MYIVSNNYTKTDSWIYVHSAVFLYVEFTSITTTNILWKFYSAIKISFTFITVEQDLPAHPTFCQVIILGTKVLVFSQHQAFNYLQLLLQQAGFGERYVEQFSVSVSTNKCTT